MDAALAGVLIAAIGPTGVVGLLVAVRQLKTPKPDPALPAPEPKAAEMVSESNAAFRTILSELTETRAQVDRCPVVDCPVRKMRWQDPSGPPAAGGAT